ncbi:MAG: hypothetical protein L0I95_12860 [Tetragenococcus koreensis]|nr:hypothetical protein [Tetragenococcus koreensis]MDN6147206.1 hypothetical protein [Tetragenococcus koreensis]
MKIKTKKQLNLPQLIEEIVQNDIINTFAELKSEYPAKQGIQIDRGGRLHLVGMDYLSKNNTFTVTTEEEIDEDTELDLIERFIGGMGYSCYTTHRMTIKECLRRSPEECTTTHFYIENDDQELILIWRDGKLVE